MNNGDGTYTFYNDSSIKSVTLDSLYLELEERGDMFISGWWINFNK